MYTWDVAVQTVASGALLGLLYALVAIGFSLLLGVIGYVNFAHGQLMMLSMYIAYVLNVTYGWDPFASVIVTIPFAAALASVIFWVVGYRAAESDQSVQVVTTLALLLILTSFASLIWGPTERHVQVAYDTSVYIVGGIRLSQPQVWAGFLSVGTILSFFAVLQYTDVGKAVRATAQNRVGAALSGINTKRILLGVMIVAAVFEAIAGSALAPISGVNPLIGFDFLLKSFVIVVLSGPGAVGGALVIAVAFGIAEALASLYVGSRLATALIFAVLVLFVIVRPQGLFIRRSAENVA